MTLKKPYIVAGPCSVESRQQLETIVKQLSALEEVSLIRCGVWKPRTRPGGFEGLGVTALQWMAELRQQLPCKVAFACEVARPEHVDAALHYGIDTVWVGARTTANPFLVQELSEALRGWEGTVLIKNAPSPDVQLWMGAIERFHQAGIKNLIAVHRGFDLYQNDGYRNSPLWEIPIELRRSMPDLPILCDPSHIAGKREPIAKLSQTAMDLGFDGLMIEVHPDPDNALTDAAQQITTDALHLLLQTLTIRSTDSGTLDEQLQLLRSQIDSLDDQLLHILAARSDKAMQIAQVKAQGNMAVFQPGRWDSLLHQRMAAADELGLDKDFVKALFEKIHSESVRIQTEAIKN